MLQMGIDDIRDRLDAHITALITDLPKTDVIAQLTADELKQLWDAEQQRITQLISSLQTFLTQLEGDAKQQIDKQINLDFEAKPKGSFSLYMDTE